MELRTWLSRVGKTKKDAANANPPRRVVNMNVAFQPYHSAITIPMGTPTTFASVKPPKTNDIARPRLLVGMVSLATIMLERSIRLSQSLS